MSDITSYEIKEALARKHGQREFFITECKNGPTGVATGQLLQFDGLAIYKSWSNPQIRGYEIKISRSDFLRDAKYSRYLPYCHEFYFVVPTGMVQRQEIEENIGLIWYNQQTGTLTTKKKAVWRNIEIDALMLLYIIMYRIDSERAPFMLHKEEAFKAYLDGKETNRDLAHRVRSKLIEENARLEARIREYERLEDHYKKLDEVQQVMNSHGISTWGHAADNLEAALRKTYPEELDGIRASAQSVVASIDKLKFKIEKEKEART